MTRFIKFNCVEDKISLSENSIVSINFENRKAFLSLINDIESCNSESIQYFDNSYNDINLSKESTFLESYFSIDFNEKKILTQIYKDVELNLTPTQKDEYNDIINGLTDFVNEVSLDIDGDIVIDDDIPLSKILNVVDLKFDDVSNYEVLPRFIQYLKICSNIKPIHLVFTQDFLKLLSVDEIRQLEYELKLLEICLIDVSYMTDLRKMPLTCITIDSDLCEF